VHKNVKNEPKTWKTARGTSIEAWRTKNGAWSKVEDEVGGSLACIQT